ncbi:MAG: hypothetical protein ACRDT6_26045, partial [Micromonosporaceae bacterium]
RDPGEVGGPAYGVPMRCDPVLFRAGEEPLGPDRRFRIDAAAGSKQTYRLSATALPRTGGAPEVRAPGSPLGVTATSQLAGDPAVSPFLAVDGNPDTAWVADVTDLTPILRLRWQGARTVDRIRITPARQPAAAAPAAITVRTLQGSVDAKLKNGVASFPAITTDHLDIVFPLVTKVPLDPSERRSDKSATLGIAELSIPGMEDVTVRPAPDQKMTLPCGTGPGVLIDGKKYDTSIVGHYGDLQAYRLVEVVPCGTLEDGIVLRPGEHRIRTLPSDRFVVHDIVLRPAESPRSEVARRDVTIKTWGPTRRSLSIAGGGESYLFFPENANAGWTATLAGRTLTPVRIDGWQQGWIVPEGEAGEVVLEFGPNRTYQLGLLTGLLAVVLLLVAVAWPARRRAGADFAPDPGPAAGRRPEGPVTGLVLLALLGLIGGVLPIAGFLLFVLVRRATVSLLPMAALGGLSAATLVAVTGRLIGEGQAWALGVWSQAAALIALAAVAAAYVQPQNTEGSRE